VIPFDYFPFESRTAYVDLKAQVERTLGRPRKNSPYCVLVRWQYKKEATIRAAVVSELYSGAAIGLTTRAALSANDRREGKPRFCDLKYDHPSRWTNPFI